MVNSFDVLSKNLKILFSHSKEINIIDDYSILLGIKESTIKKITECFSRLDTLKTINIFMQHQMSKDTPFSYLFIKRLPSKINFEKKEKLLDCIQNKQKNIKMFFEALKEKNIECNFIVYKTSKGCKNDIPKKLHGRYWLTNKSGIMVDGSLNTIDNCIVLAQKMDDNNYQIIYDFFENVIKQSKQMKYNCNNLNECYEKTIGYIMGMKESGE